MKIEVGPQKYGTHVPVCAGTPCVACGRVVDQPVTDHCHVHGWVRGVLCRRCNSAMGHIDGRFVPRGVLATGDVTLDQLLAHAARCHECPPLDALDLGRSDPPRLVTPEASGGSASVPPLGIQAARQDLRTVVDDALVRGTVTVIERHGLPVAAVVPFEWLQRADALMAQQPQPAKPKAPVEPVAE